MLRVPNATYRIQFNAGFTFNDARRIADYLAELGISDIYASPILKARKGSLHGYDVVDASALNPELGSDDDFNALHQELRRLNIGFLLDIVPNHMAATHENVWWMSVLENGPQSRYFHYFDIEHTGNKLLLPVLGRPYGEVLEAGEIKLAFDKDGFYFSHYDKRLPLAPTSYIRILRECVQALPKEGVAIELRDLVEREEAVSNSRFLKETLARIYDQSEEFRRTLEETIKRLNGRPGDIDSVNDLDDLLDAQHYRLAYWRIASEKINYRRFFDVTDLIGVRVENPEVFEVRNRRHFELIAEGKLTGLRIDHIDGLYDPIGYLTKLQLRLTPPTSNEQRTTNNRFYIVVEKILTRDEELPGTFQAAGTTGYDFLGVVDAVFVDPAGLQRLTEFYRTFTGVTDSFPDICYERKKQVISELFSGEMRALGKRLGELSLRDRNARDFTPSELLAALTEITACLDVYRTYIREVEPKEADRRCIRRAIEQARCRAGAAIDPRVFKFVELVLLVEPPSYLAGERENWLAFVMRWQQFTGRVMAKGVEDTALYNYNRLISLNEVGGEPGRDPEFDPVEEFHCRNERIQRDWLDTINATSTHDTKRSQDVRARISVLSEIAEAWAAEATRWSNMNARCRVGGAPEPNTELFLYQTLLGMWPLDEEERDTVQHRLDQYLEKAAREAKTYTSWIDPNPVYEDALKKFAAAILQSSQFCKAFDAMQNRIAFHGFLNALSQVVLKITAPGVPDFYQGTEMWDFSLVDPDNRRPVDYEQRRSLLKKLKAAWERGSIDLSTMLRRWFDGRIKLFVTWKALELRARRAEVFRGGSYRPLRSGSPNVCAFLRGEEIIVAVPRLTTKLAQTVPIGDVWNDATLPLDLRGSWRNVFTGETIESSGSPLRLSQVFATFPVAILER